MAIRQFVAIFGQNVAIFMARKIVPNEQLGKFNIELKKWRKSGEIWLHFGEKVAILASFWRKSGDFEHLFCGAKSGDFGTLIWLSRKK